MVGFIHARSTTLDVLAEPTIQSSKPQSSAEHGLLIYLERTQSCIGLEA